LDPVPFLAYGLPTGTHKVFFVFSFWERKYFPGVFYLLMLRNGQKSALKKSKKMRTTAENGKKKTQTQTFC
jgi:hypothetical protein